MLNNVVRDGHVGGGIERGVAVKKGKGRVRP